MPNTAKWGQRPRRQTAADRARRAATGDEALERGRVP